MSGLIKNVGRPIPSRYDYIVNYMPVDRSKYFGSDIDIKDVMIDKGPDAQDFTDITEMARRFLSPTSETLSKDTNPFYEMIAGAGGVKDIEHDFVRWKVYGEPERGIKSYGDPNNCKRKCIGAGRRPFQVRLDSPFLKPGQVLAPNVNKSCQVKVISECTPRGGAYDYDVVMIEEDGTFPVEFFKAGLEWIRMGGLTGTWKSGEAAGTEFGAGFTYLQFEVPLTTMQFEYSISEAAWLAAKYIKVQKCASADQPPKLFGVGITDRVMEEFKNDIKRQKELWLIYGRSTKTLTDSVSKGQEMTSPGLMEWAEQAQNVWYSPTANGIDKMVADLSAIWFDSVPISQRNITFYTGQGGLELWQCWIEEKYGNTVTMTTEDAILGTSTPFEAGRKGRSFQGYQFTKYHLPVFGSISVKHWSLLDNTRINPTKMPGTYYPISSYEFWAFDNGRMGGSSNLMILRNKHKERTQIHVGSIAPNGYVGPNNPIWKSHSLPDYDGYKYRYRCSLGLVALRMDSIIRFMPDVL